MPPPTTAPPQKVVALFHQGLALHQQGQLAQAKVIYEQVLAKQPHHFDALHLLGVIAYQTKNPALAVDQIRRAIEVNPRNAASYSNLGLALQELHQLEDAVVNFDRAIALKPDYVEAYFNRGIALHALKRLEDALASYDRAIEIKPNDAQTHSNRGMVLVELQQIEDAITSYDHAIHIKPDYAEGYWNKAIALLLNGQFEQGWQLYEWRWKNEKTMLKARPFLPPLWLGREDLRGKTILLHAEQGLGDTIQFCRYAKLVRDLGAKVLLEVPQPLVGLFQGLDGVDHVIEKDQPLPAFDYHCPLLSLPLAFKTELNTIPGAAGYLTPSATKREEWSERLGQKTKLRVGLVWSGNALYQNDPHRSLPLAEVVKYLPAHIEFISLQKEVRDADKAVLRHSTIQHYGEQLMDFTDTAALCDLMDLVISVDTSVAHLAGAIGRPTWVLLPYAPSWRWLLHTRKSPWYSSVKLYRQEQQKWAGRMLEQVAQDLRKITSPATKKPSVQTQST